MRARCTAPGLTQLAALLALAAACAGPSTEGTAPVVETFAGDPVAIAAATPALEARASALRGARHLEAACSRSEFVAEGQPPFVDVGRLIARRDPACVVMTVTAPQPRHVREDARTRLVLQPFERRATRITYPSNPHGTLAVAALFLDLATLAVDLELTATTPEAAEGAGALRVVLTPRTSAARSVLKRLELVLVPGQDVPRTVVVFGTSSGRIEYSFMRPVLDPAWKDAAARFEPNIPADYALDEQTSG